MLNNLLKMHLKLLQKEQFKKQQKQLGDLIGNKTADRDSKVSKNSPHNSSETNEEKILGKRYISPEKRQKIIDDL